jgi:hypothetical protein
MTPETLILAERAERTRMDAIRLCRETDETLRQSTSVRVVSEKLRGELGREIVGFVAQARRTADIREGAGL